MKQLGTLLALAALLSSACTLSTRYRKPDTPDSWMRQEFVDCQNQLAKGRPADAAIDQEELDRCMMERGYFVSS